MNIQWFSEARKNWMVRSKNIMPKLFSQYLVCYRAKLKGQLSIKVAAPVSLCARFEFSLIKLSRDSIFD